MAEHGDGEGDCESDRDPNHGVIITDKRKLHELGDKAQRLGELKKHPSWSLLASIFEKKRSNYFEHITARLMAGDNLPDDFDYKRGFFAGAAYILAHPENAESMFNMAIKKVQAESEGDT